MKWKYGIQTEKYYEKVREYIWSTLKYPIYTIVDIKIAIELWREQLVRAIEFPLYNNQSYQLYTYACV